MTINFTKMTEKINNLIYTTVIIFGSLLFLSNSCEKLEIDNVPVLETLDAIEITQTSAVSGGVIIEDRGEKITARGVCWSIDKTPNIDEDKTSRGTGEENFAATLRKLEPGTTYYVRAFATNRNGTGYGIARSFTTNSSRVVDVDGNVYKIIEIGDQTWMAENLKTAHYRNGDAINDGTGAGTVSGEAKPKYWFAYNDDLNNVSTYGRLYTWYTVNDGRDICPQGWHVATDAEWIILGSYLGGEKVAGGKLKETGTAHWAAPNRRATNKVGFTALPGGYRQNSQAFTQIGTHGYWWSATEHSSSYGSQWSISVDKDDLYRDRNFKPLGYSVRCIRD